jgi:hypothetical protein
MSFVRARHALLVAIALLTVHCDTSDRTADHHITGTTNTIPVFINPSSIGDSLLTQVGGVYLHGPQFSLNSSTPTGPGDLEVTTINGLPPGGGPATSAPAYDVIIAATFAGGNFAQSNNVTFSSLGKNTLVICDVTGQRSGTITGFNNAGVIDGQTLTLLRKDLDNSLGFSLPFDNGASSVGNRIYVPGLGGITWQAMQIISFVYSTTTSHWQQR